jgi:hypothetical protein
MFKSLPAGLIDEAEALLAELEAEAEAAAEAADAPPEHVAPEPEPEQAPAPDPLAAILPGGLIEEAEAMVDQSAPPDKPSPKGPPPEVSSTPPPVIETPLPADILDEPERLWEEGMTDDPGEPTTEGR